MIKMNPKITIGLCVKNSSKTVKAAFNSISIQDYPHELMKLVIVDNGSTDDTLLLIMKFAKETDIKTFVTSSKGKGLGATRQIAVDNAEGKFIVWIDDDLVLSKEYIRKQVEFLEKNSKVGAARGINIQASFKISIITLASFGVLLFPYFKNPKTIGTGGAIFRLEGLKGVGGFDIRIKGAAEDIDLSNRLREKGWVLSTNNSAKLFHMYPTTTVKALWKKNVWYGYGNHYLFHKYSNTRALMEYFPPLTLLGGIKMSYSIYRVTKLKKTLAFIIPYSFSRIAQFIGFIRANLDKYGHTNSG
jgi:glycosyltransferase involved in cell wall biosynthesis